MYVNVQYSNSVPRNYYLKFSLDMSCLFELFMLLSKNFYRNISFCGKLSK